MRNNLRNMLPNKPHNLSRERFYFGKAARDLNELVASQAQDVFSTIGIIIPSVATSTFDLISRLEPVSLTEVSKCIDQSHQRLGQHFRSLDRLGLIEGYISPRDERVRLYELTDLGRQQLKLLHSYRKKAEVIIGELFDEIGADLTRLLDDTIKTLEEKSLSDRLELTGNQTVSDPLNITSRNGAL